MTTIQVAGERPYPVYIGQGLITALPGAVSGADRVAVIHAPPLAERAEEVAIALRGAGHRSLLLPVPDGELAKSIEVAAICWAALGAARFTRTDAIVSLGGGAVTDLAGFVAACWLRGVRVVHVPTSLLAMVDAAVGGKTAVNTAAGKNLVGAFYPPSAVICDMSALITLPARDLLAGFAEVVKCGFIVDPVIIDLIEADPAVATDPDGLVLPELVARAVRVKADVVAADLHDTGRREILNYGHTLGHAIEKVEGFHWRHGDAVAVGMVFAAELARAAGRLDPVTADRHRAVLSKLGLPVTYDADAWPTLREAMRIDKKARGALQRLVILDGLARPAIMEAPDEVLLETAYRRMVSA